MDEKAVAALLGGWDRILILTHRRPDGDTTGCAAGLCALLRQIGKTAWVQENPEATSLISPYLEGYVAPPDFVPDKVVSVDVSTVNLLTPAGKAWADRIDLAIDHHPSNEGFARVNYVEPDKAACGEIVFKLVDLLGELTPEIATPLYLAVSTDTGGFLYTNTTAHTHAVAARLMEQGIDYQTINKKHFRTKSMARLRMESVLLDSMGLFEDGKAAVVSYSLEDVARVGAKPEDVEDIAAFVGQIQGVIAAATVREITPGECRISVRSVDPEWLDACAACALLGGGGHRAAAGCSVYGAVEEARAAIRQAMEQVRHGA